ncbi:MAG: hypothetical protein IT210_05120 [Armatimonadetes bacterium]|nr:hypothetical protein [Armatimonadota bacterium]
MLRVVCKQWIVPVAREEDWDAMQPGDSKWFCVSSDIKLGDKLFIYWKDIGITQIYVNNVLPRDDRAECSDLDLMTVTAQLLVKLVKPVTAEDLKGAASLAGLCGLAEGFPEGDSYGIRPELWEPFRDFVMKMNSNIIFV